MSDELFPMACAACGRPLKNGKCLWCEPKEAIELPALPYAGSSGHSGSDTSRERAERDDKGGKTKARQVTTMRFLAQQAEYGCTWNEVGAVYGWHHGQASGVLSVLHKEGHIVRLRNRRGRSAVYVLPQYVHGRETSPHGAKPKLCSRCLCEIEEAS